MKKYILTTFTVFSFILTSSVYAYSEVTGTITTGVETGISGISGVVIVKPTASPVAGTYSPFTTPSAPFYVILTGGAGTVEIRYTIDGSIVNCTTGTVYTTPILVSTSLYINAISCYPNNINSGNIVFPYIITQSPPVPAPSGRGGGGGGRDTTPETESYDFNSDEKIDIFDFNILINNWGSTSATDKTTGDANGDGRVDIFDFNLLIINWQS